MKNRMEGGGDNPEVGRSPEVHESHEDISSHIELRFLRHDAKESAAGRPDELVPLTPEGRSHARASSADSSFNQTVYKGSPRERAQHTAALVAFGASKEITGQETYAELTAKINEGLTHGTRGTIDQDLNFVLNEETPFGALSLQAFTEGRYLKFLVEESDALSAELKDNNESTTYSGSAAQIARIISKYLQVSPQWHKLANDPDKHYDPTLKRVLGTHQTVSECFLAKVLELTKGIEARDEFVALLGNKGFGFSEGCKVDIEEGKDGTQVRISYRKEIEGKPPYEVNEIVDPALITAIAEGGE